MRKILSYLIFSLLPLTAAAQVVINEVMAYNTSTIQNPQLLLFTDWIELHNRNDQSVDLTDYALTDEKDEPDKWMFPAATIIHPGQYLLVWADNPDHQLAGLHASFKLDVAGETLYLTKPDSALVLDSITFNRQFENVSFGRNNNDEHVYMSNPTPGNPNDHSSGYKLAFGITFDPPPGMYATAQNVKLTWDKPGATIRYTLDGSEPDENSQTYLGPIHVNSNAVIRTKIWADDHEPGWIETGTYLIGENVDLPVFSLVTDPPNLWDDYIGIYVEGLNGIPGYCNDNPMNFNQDWERPLSIEYFDLTGTRKLQIDGGTKIFGGCSRGSDMKSLAFYARNEYGNNEIRYPFFREKPETDWFKDLVFRNSGNDCQYTLIRDALMQAIVKNRMDVDAQAYEPVIVFLNGEYWGIHNLREKLNEHYIFSNYRIPSEEIDFLERWQVFAGSPDGYDELTDYLNRYSLAPQENYEWVADRIDMNEYMNYLIVQMYFANDDWPGNNQKYWRHRTANGKWRWILFDLDFGMGLYGFEPAQDMFSFCTATDGPDWPNPPWSTLMIRRLLENEGFRKEFISRYMMHLNSTFLEDRVIGVIDSIYGMIESETQRHYDRWGQPWSMERWANNIEQLRDYARLRPEYVWQNMRNFFNLGRVITFNITGTDTAGMVIMNGSEIPLQGFSGRYLQGYPVELEALPSGGNTFSQWKVEPGEYHEVLIIPRHTFWKYYDAGSFPGPGWNNLSFNDTNWKEGAGELGYGDGNEATILDYGPDPNNKYVTSYFRLEFEIPDTSLYSEYTVRLMRDDGAVIYINGEEVLRSNMPQGYVTYDTYSTTYVGGDDENAYFEFSLDKLPVQPGTNVIAVEIHQTNGTSSDISFDLEFLGNYYTKGEIYYLYDSHVLFEPEEGITITPVFKSSDTLPKLIINEFMASNQSAYPDEAGEYEDWIEIFNAGQHTINLAGFYFTDNLADPYKYRIPGTDPELTTVEPGDYTILFADQDTLQGPLHLNFRLGADGEEIGLYTMFQDRLTLVDSVIFGPQATDLSFGRYPDGANDWKGMTEYTPGAENIYLTDFIVEENTFRMQVYPNPASEQVYVSIRDFSTGPASGFLELKLFDLSGRLILSRNLAFPRPDLSYSLNISQVPPGFYFLKACSGNTTVIERLIIQ